MGSIPALIPQSWMHNRIDSEALKIPMLGPTPSLQDSDVTGPGCSLGIGLFFFFNPLQVILMCSPGRERLLWSLESQQRPQPSPRNSLGAESAGGDPTRQALLETGILTPPPPPPPNQDQPAKSHLSEQNAGPLPSPGWGLPRAHTLKAVQLCLII